MIKSIRYLVRANALATTFLFFSPASVSEEIQELAPPSYQVIDPASVNVATGQLSPSVTDVSIGGENGLAHTLSSYTSNFVNWEGGPLGFNDNFNGVVYRTIIYQPVENDLQGVIYGMRVSDGESTADFKLLGGGHYEAFGDPRYELNWVAGKGYVLTKPDGTKVYYSNGDGISQSTPPNEANNKYAMTKKVYPNGFTVYVSSRGFTTNSRYSVRTNTGYQLKYVYEVHNRPIDESKQNFQPNNSYLPPASSSSWSADLPRYIYAINNSYEYCPHSQSTCSLSMTWPKATHTWPDGMPRAAYIGESVFSVEDPEGRVTDFHHKAYDIAVDENGDPFPGYLEPDTHFRPRISKIVYSSGETFTYTYRNEGSASGSGDPFGAVRYIQTGEAELQGATSVGGNASWGYSIGNSYSPNGEQDHILNGSGGYKGVNHVIMQTRYGKVAQVDSWNMFVDLEPSSVSHYDWRVDLVRDKLGGGTTEYEYDYRGNVTKKTTNGISVQSEYPDSCTTSNRKYCNKPEWVADAKGNKTYYTYHSQSGQVKSITKPADESGLRPKTVFEYAQKYAYAKNASGNRYRIADPIWMKVKESYCVDSAYSGGTCAGGDKVTINYKYDNDNLHLTEKTVHSQADNATHRTCYQYDRFGNRIGQIEPESNKTSCQ